MSDDPGKKDLEATTTLIKKDWQERLAAIKKGPSTQPAAEAELTAMGRSNPLADHASPSFDSPGALPQLIRPPAEAGAAPGGDLIVQPTAAADHDGPPGGDVGALVTRLQKIEGQQRRQRFLIRATLGMLGVLLAAQVFLMVQNQPLDLRDQIAQLRALSPRPQESSGLSQDDQGQQVRAELKLRPNGDPKLNLEDKRGLPSHRASQAEAIPKDKISEAKVVYVGSKTSNKYHYTTCKWAKEIKPGRLKTFKSVEEARKHHYSPCPTCKPPPLAK